ncbi:hypothetical protein [Criblamydia sequanensis]|uniref:Uncharacterized protein n=1 Tax=Candidatus Criblamydia sequanensis CRIB-18 TaxID=1437425 RepID=A0A090CZM9_9BACT|nr:hypothetical protein [Criblamydia sequanensis]CDR32905.1 hypothetical protein CSEC_0061 [Criblamydia sequanensis CRIB-18]
MEASLNSPIASKAGFENLTIFSIEGEEAGSLGGSRNRVPTYEITNHLATSLFEDSDENDLDRLLKECQDLNAKSEASKSYLSLFNYETNFSNIINNREYAKASELITFLRRELPGFDEDALIKQFVFELKKHITELYERIEAKDVSKYSELFSVANWQTWEDLNPSLLPFAECFQVLDCTIKKKQIPAELAEKYKSHAYFLFEILKKRVLVNNFNGIQNEIQLFLDSFSETREDPLNLNHISKNRLIALKIICAHRTKNSFTNEEVIELEKEYSSHLNIVRFPLFTSHYYSFLIEHNLIEKLLTQFKEKKIKEDQLPDILNTLYLHKRWDVFLTLHNDYQSDLIDYSPSLLYKFYYLLNIAHQKLSNNIPFDPSILDNPILALIAEAAITVYDRNDASMQKMEEKLISFAGTLSLLDFEKGQNFEAFAYDFLYRRLLALGKVGIAFEEMEKRHLSGKLLSPKTFVILGLLNHVRNSNLLWAVLKLPPASFLYQLSVTLINFSKTRKESRLNLEHLDKLFYADESYDYGTSLVYLNALTIIGGFLSNDEDKELKSEISQRAIALARKLLREYPSSQEIYFLLMINYLGNYIDFLPDIVEEALYFVSDKLTFISKCLNLLYKHQSQSHYPSPAIRTCIFKMLLAAYSFDPMPKRAYDLVATYSKLTQNLLSKPYHFNLSTKEVDFTEKTCYEWNHVQYLTGLAKFSYQFLTANNFIQSTLLIPKKFPFQVPSEVEQSLLYLNNRSEQFLENKLKELLIKHNENNPLHLISIAEELPFFTNFKDYSVKALSLKIAAQISLMHFDNARRSLKTLRDLETLSNFHLLGEEISHKDCKSLDTSYHLLSGDLYYQEGKFEDALHHYDRLLKYQSYLEANSLFKIAHSKLKSRPSDPTIAEDLLKVILKDNSHLPAYDLLRTFLEANNKAEVVDVIARVPRTHEYYYAAITFYALKKDYQEVVRHSLEFESMVENIAGKEHYAFLIGEFYYKSLVKLDKVNEIFEERKEKAPYTPKNLDPFFELHYWLNLDKGDNVLEIIRVYKQKNPLTCRNQFLMELFNIVIAKCCFFAGQITKAQKALEKISNEWSALFNFMMSLLSSDFDKAMRLQSAHPYVDPKKLILTFWKTQADSKAFTTMQEPHKLVENYKKIILSDPSMDTIEHHYLFISFLKKLNPTNLIFESVKDYLARSQRVKEPKDVFFLINVIDCLILWNLEGSLRLGFYFLEKCPKKELIFKKIVTIIGMLQSRQLRFSLDPYIKNIFKYNLGFPAENYSQKRAELRLASLKNPASQPPFLLPNSLAPQFTGGNGIPTTIEPASYPRNPQDAKAPVFLDLTIEDADSKLASKPSNPITVSTSAFMREMEKKAASMPPIGGPFIAETHSARQQEIRNAPLEPTHIPIGFTIPNPAFQPNPPIFQPVGRATYSESFSLSTQNVIIPSSIQGAQPMETATYSESFSLSTQNVIIPSSIQGAQPMETATYSESFSLSTQNVIIPSSIQGAQPMETGPDETNEKSLDIPEELFQTSFDATSEGAKIELYNLDDFELETLGSGLLAEGQERISRASDMPEEKSFLPKQEVYPNLELFDSLSESDKELAGLLEIHSFKHLSISSEEDNSFPNSRIELYRLYESLSNEGKACLASTLKMTCQQFNSWLENDRVPFIKSSLEKQNGVFAFSYHSKPIGELLYAIVLELNKNQVEANNAIIERTFFYFISHILRVTKASNGYCYGVNNKKAIQGLNPKLWSLIEKAGEINASRFPPKEKRILAVIALTYKNLLSELLSHFTSNIKSFFSTESYDSSVLHSRGIDVSFIYKQKDGIYAYYSCFLFDSNGFPLSTFGPSKLNFSSFSNYSLPVPHLGKAQFEKGQLSKLADYLITGRDFPKILFVFSNKRTLTSAANYIDERLCFPYLESFSSNTGQTTREVASLLYSAESKGWLLTDLKYRSYMENPPKNPKSISLERQAPSTSYIRKVSQTALSKKYEPTAEMPLEAKLLKTSNVLENNHKRKAEALKKPASLQKGKEKETLNLLSIEEGVLEFKKLFKSIKKNNLISFEKVRDISYLLREYIENQMDSNLPIVLYPRSSDSEDALILDLLIHPIRGKKWRILYRTESANCQETADYFKDAILAKKLEHFESSFASIEKQIRHNQHTTARKRCVTLNYILSVILDQARMKAAKTRFEGIFVNKVRRISQKLSLISQTHSFKLYNISNVNDLFSEERKAFLSQFIKPLKVFLLTSPEDLVSARDPKAPLFVSDVENHALHSDAKDLMAIFNANNFTIYKHKTLYFQSTTSLQVDFLIDLLFKNAYFTSLFPPSKELPKILNEMRQKVCLSAKQIEHSSHEETKNQAYQCLKQWFFLQCEFILKIRSSFFDFNKDSRSFTSLILSLINEEATQESVLNLIKNFLREQKVSNGAGIAFLEEVNKDSNFYQEFQSLLKEHIESEPLEGPRFPGRWFLKEEERLKRPLPIRTIRDEGLKEFLLSNNTGFDSYFEKNWESPSRIKAASYAEIAELERAKRTKRQSKLFRRDADEEPPIFPSSGFFPTWSQNSFQSSTEGLENPIFYQKNQEIFNTTEFLRLAEEELQAKKEKYRHLLEEKEKKESQSSHKSNSPKEGGETIELTEKEAESANLLKSIFDNLKDTAEEIYLLTKTVEEVKFSLYTLKADLSLFNLNCRILKFNSFLREESLGIPELKSLKEKIIDTINECFIYLSNQYSWLQIHHYNVYQRSPDDKPSLSYPELQLSFENQKLAFRESVMDLFSIFPSSLAYEERDIPPLNTSYYLFFIDTLTDSLLRHFEKLNQLREQENKCEEKDPAKIFLVGQIEIRKALCAANFKELDFYFARWKRLYKEEPEKLNEIQVYFDKAQEAMKALFTGY